MINTPEEQAKALQILTLEITDQDVEHLKPMRDFILTYVIPVLEDRNPSLVSDVTGKAYDLEVIAFRLAETLGASLVEAKKRIR